MRDDDALDLSAWEAPPPPDGIADAVIARMDGTAVGLAMPEDPPSRKRALVIGASAAAALLVVAGAWAILRGREHAPPVAGELVAGGAQHVELGGASADLDRGAEIQWQRTGGRLHVDQKAGTAVWRVGEEHVEIAAAVASVEATNASLKVEVPMNLTDARVIGASAVTAAAVAMVTVVVYEGHVKVHHDGQTVVVQPGTTFTVPPPAPEPPVVGVAPATVPAGPQKIAVLGLEGWSGDAVPRELVDALRARANVAPFVLAPDSEKELVDEKLLYNCTDEQPSCMAAIGRDLGADLLIYGSMEVKRAGYQVVFNSLDVVHTHPIGQVTLLIPAFKSQGAALSGYAKTIFAKLTAQATACDAAVSIEKGTDAMGAGQYAAALASYEQALACDPTSDHAIRLAYFASCKIRDVPKARAYWRKLSAADQTGLLPMCLQQGISRDDLEDVVKSQCDADDLVTKGEGADTRGEYAESLVFMEKALACDPSQSDRIVKMAVMEACKSKNTAKAKQYLGKVTEPMRGKLTLICERQGVTLATCNADELAAKGENYIAAGQYVAAIAALQEAFACKPDDEHIVKLGFLASCKARNAELARKYYGHLTPDDRSKYVQMCTRQGITRDDLEGMYPAASDKGTLRIACNPTAHIAIDGNDTGQTTPSKFELAPGKHKVTFVIGGDRFTYPVTIKAGETETISNDLH
jgi:tetratricopeptide (TPR) repeat protein